MLGPDLWDGSVGQLQSYANSTGTTYPLLLNGTSPTGGDLNTLYGPYDDFVVVNRQGLVRYHAALTWPHGNRYHLNEIRGSVDTLVASIVGVNDLGTPRAFRLSSSPNPFGGSASIVFAHPRTPSEHARITVHDLAGRELATLWEGDWSGGETRIAWDGRVPSGLAPPGVYVIRAQVGTVRLSRRIVYIR